jgi:hypothetical protein
MTANAFPGESDRENAQITRARKGENGKGISKRGKVSMNTNNTIEMAHYFGLNVEVICKLENSSLIRYRGRESIVDTTDLVFIRRLKHAA